MMQIKETGWVELIGTDEKIDQNEWSGSVNLPIKQEGNGMKIYTVLLRQGYDKSAGAALSGTGTLAFCIGDPDISAGTASNGLTRTQVNTIRGAVALAAGDWVNYDDAGTDASDLAVLHMESNEGNLVLPPLADDELYVAFLWTLATSINSGASDEEDLYVKIIYGS